MEDVLFTVPKRRLESTSSVFKDMFSMPHSDGVAVEGQDELKPIVLEGYKAIDFERLLTFLDPS